MTQKLFFFKIFNRFSNNCHIFLTLLDFYTSVKYDGFCLDKDEEFSSLFPIDLNPIVNKTIIKLSSDECLAKCYQQGWATGDVTGCEYQRDKKKCSYHTSPVVTGTGNKDLKSYKPDKSTRTYFCWIFKSGNILRLCTMPVFIFNNNK